MRRKEAIAGYLFALPCILGSVVFFLYPFIISIYFSFTSGVGGSKFVGFANFKELLASGTFRMAAGNTFRFVLVSVPLVMLLSLLLALLLNSGLKYARAFRTFFILPLVVPIASVIIMWQVIFEKNGALNAFLSNFGVPAVNFLSSGWTFYVLVLIYLWKNSGYNIVLFLAGFNGIDPSLYEAAQIDGARKGACFWHITVPMLGPTLFFVFVMSMINSFKVFREAYLLAGSYPHESIYMLQHYMNNNFYKLNYQHISTASILFFLVVAALVFLLFRYENKTTRERV